MTIEQTIDVPASRLVQFSPELPVGRFRVVFFPEPNAVQSEALPRVTRAQRAEWAKDPVIQELDNLSVEPDWSWLPEGKTPETFTMKDAKAMRIKEKYGV
ncbi:hypothetical protein FACS1894110_20090 [Spirochaetia bacterium]|nr:hypothetical protein FACS1894110_20090 [Spirochaetia bacterium]